MIKKLTKICFIRHYSRLCTPVAFANEMKSKCDQCVICVIIILFAGVHSGYSSYRGCLCCL